MKWSVKLGSIAGIKLYMHATFLILLAWIAWLYWRQFQDVVIMLQGVLFILLLFACVVLHELGHALTARRYGIPTRDITLLPIGGLARLQRMPDKPIQEFWVAVAGPAVNVVIAILLFIWMKIMGISTSPDQISVVQGSMTYRLYAVNIILVLFNMLPAFPMDGGRVVRALLAMKFRYDTATRIAAGLGQTMALLFGLVGLFYNPFLVFIALFVWIGAASEAGMSEIKVALGGIPVANAMLTEFHILKPDEPLSRAVGYILAGSQHDFPVVDDDGQVVGVLTRKNLINALTEGASDTPVRDAMQTEFETVNANDMLEPAFLKLQQQPVRAFPVLHNGDLVGLLTSENIGELIMIQSAMKHGKQPVMGLR